MINLTADKDVYEFYKKYYSKPDYWRWICAKGKAANVIKMASDIPAARIIDIGCGDGSVLARLSQKKFGISYAAVEISETTLNLVKSRKIQEVTDFLMYDGYHIPVKDKSFDLAVLSHVLEHVEYPRLLLREAARVSKFVILEIPLELNARLPLQFSSNCGHINVYSEKSILHLLQSSGLKPLKQMITNPALKTYIYQQGSAGIFKFLFKEMLLKLSPAIAQYLFTYHCTILFHED